MSAAKEWHVDIYIGEQDGQTYAEARLRPHGQTTLTGLSRCHTTQASSATARSRSPSPT